ncbi:hypothetical protein RUND412_011251, partial [Rhizina undulata]
RGSTTSNYDVVTNGDMSPKLSHRGVTLQFPGEAEWNWKEAERQMMEAPKGFSDWLWNRTSANGDVG